ncbi:hypothetical protein BH20BAC1_BH20BAC1_26980 [soil metagenome]
MIRIPKLYYYPVLLLITIGIGCNKNSTQPDPAPPPFEYKTKNVIIVVVDGPRYTETWGDASRTYIPKRNALLSQGVLCSALYNMGTTSTVAGHVAICTGYYQKIRNDGTAYPEKPTIFQYWLKEKNQPASKAWVITTKDKLEVLSDCTDPAWQGKYRPMHDCGNSGLGSGYRLDSKTMEKVYTTLKTDRPNLMIINYKQPDEAGHQGDSLRYLKGIADTDGFIDQLWTALQSDTAYKDKTTMIVTNDHGRHTAGYKDGFISHGDDCDGCRHVEMFAIGPDFKKNFVTNTTYEQVDITNTVAELLNFKVPTSGGKVIQDIFTKLK